MLLLRLLLALALLLAGCAAGRSQFVPAEPSKDDAIRLAAPAETVVLIYNHGSEQEFIPDPCEPAGGDASEWSVPSVLSNLNGTRFQILYLSAATRIEALIFAFEGDPYEPREDLAFLRRIPGVEPVVLSGTRIAGVSCGGRSPHLTDRKPCFHATQGTRIRDYIERRLQAAER